VQGALGVAVRGLVAGQVPHDERFVARAGEEHVRAGMLLACVSSKLDAAGCCSLLERGRQGRDPAGVALEGAAEDELLSHGCGGVR